MITQLGLLIECISPDPVWSVWYMNSTWSQSQMITQFGFANWVHFTGPRRCEAISTDPQTYDLIHMQVVSSACIKASKIFHIQKLQRCCWEHLFAREPRQFFNEQKQIFFIAQHCEGSINCNVLVYYCIDALQLRVVQFTFQMYYEFKHWCRGSSFYISDGRWFCPQWPGWILVAQPFVDA